MRKMKDSGYEWIGEIPKEWKISPLKYNYSIISGATPESSNADNWDGDIAWITPADYKTKDVYISKGSRTLSQLGYKSCSTSILPKGSIIFSKRAPIGSVAISSSELCTNQGCLGLVKCNETIDNKYFYYVLSIYPEVFNLYGSGTTFKEISANVFKNIMLPYPAVVIQEQIADFLDAKCGEIDALTADIQAQIDTLEQYKRSVITEAVTKGLDPDVEMKESGIEWCPQIPAHWEYCNPKGLFALRNDRAFPSDRQLTASQEYGIVFQDEYMEMTGNKVVTVEKDFSILKHVEPDDFVISMRSFQGGLEYSDKEGCISSAYVMLIPKKKYVYAPFYRWFLKSSKYINALQSTSNLVRDGQAMRYSNFVKVPLFIIPLDEQKQIADYLNKQVGSIDSILKGKKEQLSVLADYKKSLIYEYVTGKKEVPQAASVQATVIDPQVILMGLILNKLSNDIRGKVQIQKMLYLTNEYIGLNRGVQYYRYAHGPYDLQLEQYVDVLVSNHWYEEKHQRADLLIAGKNHNDFVEKYGDQFSDKQTEIDNLIDILRPMKTSQVERIATLFAAWNDFIIDGNPTPTDSQIIHEVMNNWTDNKANTQYTTWQGTLKKMKQHGIVPQGLGLHTLPKV